MARSQSKKRCRLGFARSSQSTSNVNPSQSPRAFQTSANVASIPATSGTLSRMKRLFRRLNQPQSSLVAKESVEMGTGTGTLERRGQARAVSSREAESATDNPGPASAPAAISEDMGIAPNAVDAVPVSRSSNFGPVDAITRGNTAPTEVQQFRDTSLKPLKTFNGIAITIANVRVSFLYLCCG
ncbi:hypothetical protein EDD17DRAFT_1087315 [Pisolithus thermaeus]|nr:hypothetical protein EDD17DRAFT_1087315 [Pisolithus thermaeus]